MRTVTVLMLPLLLACGANPAPVAVEGAAGDLRAMQGEWSGEYGSDQTGRTGSIVFRLEAGADSATGDVVMIPRGSTAPLHPVHGREVAETELPGGQALSIRFVHVEGGQVEGELEPYHEPECDCALYTVFSGRIQGDSVTGTYRTRRTTDGRETGGWWRVVRR